MSFKQVHISSDLFILLELQHPVSVAHKRRKSTQRIKIAIIERPKHTAAGYVTLYGPQWTGSARSDAVSGCLELVAELTVTVSMLSAQ